MNTTKAQRQVTGLLLSAIVALVAVAIPAAWNWASVSYTNSPTAALATHELVRNTVELLRSENAHLGLFLNQSHSDDQNAQRTLEGIESSISHELQEIKDLSTQPAPIGPAVREIVEFYGTKLRYQLQALRAPDADDAVKAAARTAWNDFDIYIGRLGTASRAATAKRLASVTSNSTVALATALWMAVLAIPALIVQKSVLRKNIASAPVSAPATAQDSRPAAASNSASVKATGPNPVGAAPALASPQSITTSPNTEAALRNYQKRASELELALEELAAYNAKLLTALDAANIRPPAASDTLSVKPLPAPQAVAAKPVITPAVQPDSLAVIVEGILSALKDRARATLSHDGRFSLVAQLGAEEGRSIQPSLRRALTSGDIHDKLSEPTTSPDTFEGKVEALLNALFDRARATLSRDDRFNFVAQLTTEEARSIEPIIRRIIPTNRMKEELSEPPTASVKPTLLMVDDDRLNRIIFKQVLGPEVDALVVEASSVSEAWKKLEEGLNPDLIITDIVMPEQDGFQFIQKLRADSRFSKKEIIVCTSHGDKEAINRAGELGITHYIKKPFAKEDVQRLVLGAVNWGSGNGRPAAFLEAQKRLGLDEESYAQLAEMLSREVSDTITYVRTAVSRGYTRAACTRMNSLRGSSQTIGDDGLANAIMAVEKELDSGDVFFACAELERLEEENSRLSKSIIHLRRNAVPPIATSSGTEAMVAA